MEEMPATKNTPDSQDADALYAQAAGDAAGTAQAVPAPEDKQTGTPAPAAPKPPAFVTVEQFQKALELIGRQTAGLQSRVDKGLSKTERQMQELASRNQQLLATAKDIGVPPEQLEKMEQRLQADAMRKAFQPEPAPTQAAPQAEGEEDPAALAVEVTQAGNEKAAELTDLLGFSLEDGDPEMALIKAVDSTPDEYLNSIAAAYKAKKNRLAQAKPPAARAPGVAPAGGRAPTNKYAHIKPGDTQAMYDLADEQFREAHR